MFMNEFKEYTLEESLGFVISKVALKFKNEMARRFRPYGVTPEQWGVIARLWYEDGLTQKELACRASKDQPNTTRILDKLEEKGLIRRADNAGDRRAFLVFLTNEGKKIRQLLFPVAAQLRQDVCAGIAERDQEMMILLLNRIWVNLE